MALELDTAPASEPVTLQEAKDHLRINANDDDAYIKVLITAAREQAEDYLHRALINQTWKLYLSAFPFDTRGEFPEAIIVPKPPLSSVTSITYTDTDGASQTVSSSDYSVDTVSEEGRITPAWGETWPSSRAIPNAVIVTFVAGYGSGASSVPARIKQGMLLVIGDMFEHRETLVIGTTTAKLLQTAETLWSPYRVERFA